MSSSPRDSAWAPTRAVGDRDADGGWEATRALTQVATQFLRDKDDYLDDAVRDIGRQINAGERELFVSCDPGPALEQQFEILQPAFIAVHDLGTQSARRLLASIAAAAKQPVQKLLVRRQGYGTALATIEFVDVPTAAGSALRLYATDCEADAASRRAIARTLLAWSRLGVVMVGEQPQHVLEAAFQGLRDDMLAPGWRNRGLLLLPLTASGMVSAFGQELARATPVPVRTTPLVTKPADAWDFITGAWSRQGDAAPAPPAPRRPTAAPAAPLEMRPMPPVPTAADRARAAAAEPTSLVGRYAQRVSDLTGVLCCTVFDIGQGRAVAHAGTGTPPAELAQQGAELLASITAAGRALGFGHAVPEAAITLGAHHLLLRPVPKHPQLAIHAVLDKAQANLTLARLQIGRLDAMFEPE